jgi:hypothetical protein
VTAACGAADKPGTCRPRQLGLCATIYEPVCGCDGTTYGNDCTRIAAGEQKAHDGECGSAAMGPCPHAKQGCPHGKHGCPHAKQGCPHEMHGCPHEQQH